MCPEDWSSNHQNVDAVHEYSFCQGFPFTFWISLITRAINSDVSNDLFCFNYVANELQLVSLIKLFILSDVQVTVRARGLNST